MNIYSGNMSYETTEDRSRQTFNGYGEVSAVKIVNDRDSGRPKGFGFVEMPIADEATAAIGGLKGRELNGRTITVNEAKPRADGGNRNSGSTYRKPN